MATQSEGTRSGQAIEEPENQEDVGIKDVEPVKNGKAAKTAKGHEITSITIKKPPFSYACLELISDPVSKTPLDDLTVRSYLTSALSQFLGLTGAAISVDILKVDDKICWIRVPRDDLSAVIAATSGWIGGNEKSGQVAWRVRTSGDWLGSLVRSQDIEKLFTG